jgi:glucokinase
LRALLADIGGTNARFALLDGEVIGPPVILSVAAHATTEDAVAAALSRLAPQGGVQGAVLALAGPVIDEPVRLTNAHWVFSSSALAARFGFRVRLVNDFLALAHALPHLAPADLIPVGGGQRQAGAPMLVLGPGTGLGAAGFLPGPALAVPTEAGHIGLAPADPWQDQVVAALRARCGRAGTEEALSGRGLANLYAVLAHLRGAEVPARDAGRRGRRGWVLPRGGGDAAPLPRPARRLRRRHGAGLGRARRRVSRRRHPAEARPFARPRFIPK